MTTDDETDAVLIERSWATPEAFAAVFDRHAVRVHRALATRLGRQGADDVLSEVFLVAFRRRESFDLSRAHAVPWLLGIAMHVVAQHRRDWAREIRLRDAVPPERDHLAHDDDVVARVAAEASRGRLAAALATLSRDERDVLLLVAWDGLHYDEVADALGVPVGTVRSRLHRARRKVRAAIGPAKPDSDSDSTEEVTPSWTS